MKYQAFKDDELGLRDHLAMDRTAMANERTFLAYCRTAIMLAATAVTLFKLFPGSDAARYISLAIILAALAIGVVGGLRYWGLTRALKEMKG